MRTVPLYKVKYDRNERVFYIEETHTSTEGDKLKEFATALNWESKSESKAGRYAARLNKIAHAP